MGGREGGEAFPSRPRGKSRVGSPVPLPGVAGGGGSGVVSSCCFKPGSCPEAEGVCGGPEATVLIPLVYTEVNGMRKA